MELAAGILVVVAIAVGIRLLAGSLDGDRIEDYLRQRNCKLVRKHWTPFGTGWAGSGQQRLYEVEYEDAAGQLHRASVKTSMLAGVYLSDDRIVQAADPADEVARLRQENEALRAELRRRT